MTEFYYTLCDAFCALTFPQQFLVALGIVLIVGGILYCLAWAAKYSCIRLLERLNLSHLLVDPEDIYDPSWMDYSRWEALRQ